MITIKVEENPQSVLSQMGIAAQTDDVVMSMTDKDELLGVGVIKLFGECANLCGIYIKDDDFSLSYSMGKALLNVADLRGAQYAVCDSHKMERVLTALKFKKISSYDGEIPEELKEHSYFLNLSGYFVAGC